MKLKLDCKAEMTELRKAAVPEETNFQLNDEENEEN